MKNRTNQIAAAAVLLLAAVCAAVLLGEKMLGTGGTVAVLWENGEEVRTVPLDTDCEFSYTTKEGHTISFAVQDGRIRFTSSDCPDKICVNTGFISLETETAVCMPNHVSLTIRES